MVEIIKGDSVDELFVHLANKLLSNGHEISRRNLKIKEINDCWLILDDPYDSSCTLKSRNMSEDYLKGEMEWYRSGSLNVKDVEKFSKFWSELADSNGTINSNYGFLTKIEKHAGMSQFEWCIERLIKDKYTRQAIMNYNQPRHKYSHVRDFVCTISQQFPFRN